MLLMNTLNETFLKSLEEVPIDFTSRTISAQDAKYTSLALQHSHFAETGAFTTAEYDEVKTTIADSCMSHTEAELEQSVLDMYELYKSECPLSKFNSMLLLFF